MSPTLLLTLAALAVLAVTLVAVGFPLIARLRAQESLSGDPTEPVSDASISEMREIGQRIETLVSQQQEQGETQRQRLAQQIDTVQQTVGEQRVLVDGLRSEVRHESKRRDHELDEIRTQIASIQQAMPALTGATALALPPAPNEVSPLEVSADEAPVEAIPEDVTQEIVSADAPQDDMFVEVVDPFAIEPLDASEPAELAISEEPVLDVSIETDTWTPDWSEANLPEATFEEVTVDFEEIAVVEIPTASPEAITEAPVAMESIDMDVFADVSSFDIAPDLGEAAPLAPHENAPQMWTEAPEMDTISMDAPVEMETFAETDAPVEDELFEELSIAEMSFVDPELTPDPFAFDPDEAALELDAIEAALSDILPGAPAAEEPETSIFMDAVVPTELATPSPVAEAAPEPLSAVEPVQAFAPESDPLTDDIFAATPFLDDIVPSADPLAFEETFVPTPVESPTADTDTEDVFASWSPSSFETAAPADIAPSTLSFTETPAETPFETADKPAPVDLSSFEDWGLDPEPVAEPIEAQAPTWAPSGSSDTTFDAWAPAPTSAPQAPAPQAPAPQAPATDTPAGPNAPNATAWVVRNETLQPSAPPAAQEAPMPEEVAMTEETPIYAEASFYEEAPVYDEIPVLSLPSVEEAPLAATPQPVATPQSVAVSEPSLATISVVPSAPVPEPISELAPEPAPAAEPQPLAEGVERLSILPSIDDDIERALHLAGVTTLDEMARWGRTEARRIATEVGVSEDTVLNHWVFEAQTALFERFTQQVGS